MATKTLRKPLSAFFGMLRPETGKALAQTIMKMRERRNVAHRRRLQVMMGKEYDPQFSS